MMRQEFEKLIGFKVDAGTYKRVIEPMYGVTELSKQAFCAMFNKSYLKRMIGKGEIGTLVSVGVSAASDNMAHVEYGILKKKYLNSLNQYVFEVQKLTNEQTKEYMSYGRCILTMLPFYELDLGLNNIVKWIYN